MKLKNIKTFEEHSSELNISDVSDSIYTPTSYLLYCMETRRGKIYVTLYHKRYFDEENFDDHDVVYKTDDKFYKEFKKTPHIKGSYNNEYNPVNFKTENECEVFLNSIGLISV
jgi:hypothetical protein